MGIFKLKFLENVSNREQNLWAELVLDLVLITYYFVSVYNMPENIAINSEEMRDLINKVILLAIVSAIIVFSLINWRDGEEKMDERDLKFEAKANAAGYITLVVSVFALIVFIVAHDVGVFSDKQGHQGGWLLLSDIKMTAMLNAHLLLIALIAASTIKALVQLFQYRRGY